MKSWKVLFAFFVLSAMAISPYMRSLSENYIYWMGFFVYLFAGILTFVEGKYFERFWALGFFSLSLYSAINSLQIPLSFYYFGDFLYFTSYILFMVGTFSYLWKEGYRTYPILMVILLLISPFLSYALVKFFKVDPTKRFSMFFNFEYVILGILNTLFTLPPATLDRAWAIRLLAFGIHGVSEIWFILWLIYGFTPTDISIIWLTPLIITLLTQRADVKMYYRT